MARTLKQRRWAAEPRCCPHKRRAARSCPAALKCSRALCPGSVTGGGTPFTRALLRTGASVLCHLLPRCPRELSSCAGTASPVRGLGAPSPGAAPPRCRTSLQDGCPPLPGWCDGWHPRYPAQSCDTGVKAVESRARWWLKLNVI